MWIGGGTKIVGIFGDPVKHSLSPSMHNAAFRALGLDYVYVPFHVKKSSLGLALKGLIAMNIRGVNLTIPHKVEALKYLDYLDKEANMSGAVNTVEVKDGRLLGYNTDGKGFIHSLKRDCGFNPKNKNVLILGAGGASRAVIVQLILSGAREIVVASPVQEELKKIAQDIRGSMKVSIKTLLLDRSVPLDEIKNIHLLINATPVGMHPQDPLLLPAVFFKKTHSLQMVYDLIYSPMKTKLLRTAELYRINTSNGLGMLLYQGAFSFEIWTKRKAPVEVMRKTLISALRNR